MALNIENWKAAYPTMKAAASVLHNLKREIGTLETQVESLERLHHQVLAGQFEDEETAMLTLYNARAAFQTKATELTATIEGLSGAGMERINDILDGWTLDDTEEVEGDSDGEIIE